MVHSIAFGTLLGGSGVAISGVIISPLIWVISIVILHITV